MRYDLTSPCSSCPFRSDLTLLLYLARHDGVYDPAKLDHDAPVYASVDVWLAALEEMDENSSPLEMR